MGYPPSGKLYSGPFFLNNLFSLAETGNVNDLLGVVVSYSVKIKLVLSGMGGELETDLPFKLVHPCPSKY